ncbi:serine hydrolase [Hyphomonas sp. FCG-A18]|uniref:serine hydrolase domain-containing protein n=1 Tax=Hyphomonas sp. FCG-A18 TaxID=3080019 RepID=UPI002B31BD95|nr:serine hydrolase [Hyphomonas sp. FCG-A18]
MGIWLKRLGIAVIVLALLAGLGWWSIGSNWRALLSDPPHDNNVLFWSQNQRDNGFRMLDQVSFMIKSKPIKAGENTLALPNGEPLSLNMDMAAYGEKQRLAGMVIVHKGKVRLEQYGLGFESDERWTSFSVAKSLTSTLVGAAIKDGHINSIEDKVTDYITDLKGSPYDDVTIAQLLTMTSGVAWNEDYSDPQSDVALFNQHTPEGDLPIIVSYMQGLSRAHPPGERWNYSTGETNLIGILVSEAIDKPVSEYLSEKVWEPYGMQQDATWLIGEDGEEISGCCIQATIRDYARFGLFVLDNGVVNGTSILPEGWIETGTQKQAEIGEPGYGYGYQWWTFDDGSFQADGIFGQGIFIDPNRDLVIASNSSWTSALGDKDREHSEREAFYRTVQAAIDAETTP